MKTYDYINRVVITLPLTVYEGTWTNTLPSRCYIITMILRVRRNFFEITTFPNKRCQRLEADMAIMGGLDKQVIGSAA